ncbi:MAG: hypothetical protein IPN20_00750 [Haliscomenobacter sp.]|nr:hypothetical protein [Haliscomenobacter sp.]
MKALMINQRILFHALVFLSLHGRLVGQVEVYSYPDTLVYSQSLGKNIRSPLYEVKVIQGEDTLRSYVLADQNTFPDAQKALMTDWHHSTTFSFSGSVGVEIIRLDGKPVGKAEVYPLAFNIPFSIDGAKMRLKLDRPRKLYVEMEGLDKQPLFIFADPREEDPPGPLDPDVLLIRPGMSASEVRAAILTTEKPIIYFDKGIHQYGPETGISYAGYKIPLLGNRTYYIPGGAYVMATFYGENASNTTVRGRGIISLCGKERLGSSVEGSFDYHALFFNTGGAGQRIEGITICNVPHYCILSRGTLDCTNVKLFGWWHQTDGFGGNQGSVISDAFIKVNDDYVKLYRNNNRAENLVVYKQINGAVLQLGWNAYGACSNCSAENIYVVKDALKTPGPTSNTAVVNLVNNGGSSIQNVSIRNLYIDNDVQRTLGIKANGGSVTNLSVSNVRHRGNNLASNYLIAPQESLIDGVKLENIFSGDTCVENNRSFNLTIEGNVSGVLFQCGTLVQTAEPLPDSFSVESRRGQIVLRNFKLGEGAMASVYDLNGRLLAERPVLGGETQIPVGNFRGIMLVQVRFRQSQWTKKIVIP